MPVVGRQSTGVRSERGGVERRASPETERVDAADGGRSRARVVRSVGRSVGNNNASVADACTPVSLARTVVIISHCS